MRRSARRLSVLTLAAAVVLLVLPPALAWVLLPPGGSFYDDDTNIHQGNIEAIAAAGITRGCNPPENTIYCPGSSVTRGQMAAFLARALELPAAATDYFVDDDGSIFESDINKVADALITRGCNPPTNDRYCPDSKVTRGQMAAFLVRALGYVDDGGGNLFTDDDGSIFEADIDRLGTAGVTKGCNPPANDRYCPDSLVLRDQMASFLSRALGLDPMDPPTGFIGTFEGTDPDASHVTIDIGPTGSDHRVSVDLFDDGATGCLNSFGEFSPASFAGTGTRLDPTHIELTAGVVCHTSGSDKVPPWSPLTGDFIYEPDHDVVTVDGVCHWRSDGGSVADCP